MNKLYFYFRFFDNKKNKMPVWVTLAAPSTVFYTSPAFSLASAKTPKFWYIVSIASIVSP